MKFILAFISFIILNQNILAQKSFDEVLDFTLSYRGLTRDDVTIPLSFDPNKSPSVNTKLILPIVEELMQQPLKYNEVVDEFVSLQKKDISEIALALFRYIDHNSTDFKRYELNFSTLDNFIITFSEFIKQQNSIRKKILSVYTDKELEYIKDNILSVISDTESGIEDKYNDVFEYNTARDTSIKISKNVMDLLNRIPRSELYNYLLSSLYVFKSIEENLPLWQLLKGHSIQKITNDYIEGEFYYYLDDGNVRIAIGSKGRNIYSGSFDFIIDLGGDDIYELSHDPSKSFSYIKDEFGNDSYTAKTDFSLASGFFSSSFIYDYNGDDVYKGKSVSLGAAIGGLGVLIDGTGNDIYSSQSFSQAASFFGVGILIDEYGNDVYKAVSFSQGFGMTEGASILIDKYGADNYLSEQRSLDIGRYEDHFISMSQGYAYGVRPYYAGGVGVLLDAQGNDLYYTDIFGQGGSYWFGLGILIDLAGHDKYNSYQYAQGSGIHLSVGILKDFDGWDSYVSNGVSQGCGHDYGVGILHDVKGNDNYSAYSLSQGAGSANGIGILIDESGRDGYLSKDEINTRGYGNPRREFGSLGIFLDASGEDFYSRRGPDSVLQNSSTWGVLTDYYLHDIPSQLSGNIFKLDPPVRTNFTVEELFIMAKTIEPRFSHWQKYGFSKLIEDSINAARFMITLLGTDDHRETSLMRNLIIKIPVAVSNEFTYKLEEYQRDRSIFTPEELSMMAYLFGFTNNPSGREALYLLTFEENIRVRTNAINSLGKLKLYTLTQIDFINKVSQRLSDLTVDKSEQKLYMKDIAFALNNYKGELSMFTLLKLLGYEYFPVRMLSADALQKYGNEYLKALESVDGGLSKIVNYPQEIVYAFLISIRNLEDRSFMKTYDEIIRLIPDNEILKLNIANEMKIKSAATSNNELKIWAEKNYSDLTRNSAWKNLK